MTPALRIFRKVKLTFSAISLVSASACIFRFSCSHGAVCRKYLLPSLCYQKPVGVRCKAAMFIRLRDYDITRADALGSSCSVIVYLNSQTELHTVPNSYISTSSAKSPVLIQYPCGTEQLLLCMRFFMSHPHHLELWTRPQGHLHSSNTLPIPSCQYLCHSQQISCQAVPTLKCHFHHFPRDQLLPVIYTFFHTSFSPDSCCLSDNFVQFYLPCNRDRVFRGLFGNRAISLLGHLHQSLRCHRSCNYRFSTVQFFELHRRIACQVTGCWCFLCLHPTHTGLLLPRILRAAEDIRAEFTPLCNQPDQKEHRLSRG